MSIRVGAGAVERIIDSGDGFALQVQHASDVGAAIGALKLARVDLLGLVTSSTTGTTVSPVVSAPGGPLMLVEHFHGEYDVMRSIPDVIKSRLEAAGVGQALIESPPVGGSLEALESAPHAVILRLFPRVPGLLPPDWLDISCEWVIGDMSANERARVRILTVEFDVSVAEVSAVVHECGLARAWCDAVNGDPAERVRTASLTYGRLTHLALAAGGPSVDGNGLIARYELLRDVARELAADCAYACIDFERTFEGLALGLSPEGWQQAGGASPNLIARDLVDERVPDAYPYQLLGPGHIARLGDVDLPAERLGDGRVEVEFDDVRLWFPTAPERADVQAEAWELLRPCLVTEQEAVALVELRAMAGGSAFDVATAPVEPQPLASTPDLDAIVLESAPHSRRGTRLTLLELASWLDHETHTDSPSRVAPVLATYARWLAAGLDDATRQTLKPMAARLLGTAPPQRTDENIRRWLATEWLVKAQAATWLRAAGLTEAAERLDSLGMLTDDVELVRAVDVLGREIGIASRRIEITASLGDDDELAIGGDDPMIWDAWERATESTGWVAASEAATFGSPSELTYATDQRVIECSRDARMREEIEKGRQTIGDSAWSTALHAIADEAWEQAWRAADRAARELSGFTIRIEVGRVAKTVLEKDMRDDELPELALEHADRAARDSLTRAALRGGTAEGSGGAAAHPWDAACNTARLSDGGSEWGFVMDEARRAVGEDAWAQAMADAREIAQAILASAPDTVARVVTASVAREASSAAARSLAVRAAAVARAGGADKAGIEAAIDRALGDVVKVLQPQAIELLERMISPARVQ